HFGLLALRRLLAATLAISLDRILAPLDLLAGDALDQGIVDRSAGVRFLGGADDLALQECERVQRELVAAPPRFDQLSLKSIVKCHLWRLSHMDRSRIIGAYGSCPNPSRRTFRRRRGPGRGDLRDAPSIGAGKVHVLGAAISDRAEGARRPSAHAGPDRPPLREG